MPVRQGCVCVRIFELQSLCEISNDGTRRSGHRVPRIGNAHRFLDIFQEAGSSWLDTVLVAVVKGFLKVLAVSVDNGDDNDEEKQPTGYRSVWMNDTNKMLDYFTHTLLASCTYSIAIIMIRSLGIGIGFRD